MEGMCYEHSAFSDFVSWKLILILGPESCHVNPRVDHSQIPISNRHDQQPWEEASHKLNVHNFTWRLEISPYIRWHWRVHTVKISPALEGSFAGVICRKGTQPKAQKHWHFDMKNFFSTPTFLTTSHYRCEVQMLKFFQEKKIGFSIVKSFSLKEHISLQSTNIFSIHVCTYSCIL